MKSDEKGIISRDPTIKCRKVYINENTVSVDGEVMGYVTKLTISIDKPNSVTVECLLPVKNGIKNGKSKNGDTKKFEKATQTIFVEKK